MKSSNYLFSYSPRIGFNGRSKLAVVSASYQVQASIKPRLVAVPVYSAQSIIIRPCDKDRRRIQVRSVVRWTRSGRLSVSRSGRGPELLTLKTLTVGPVSASLLLASGAGCAGGQTRSPTTADPNGYFSISLDHRARADYGDRREPAICGEQRGIRRSGE